MNAILPGIALAALSASAFAEGPTVTTLTGRTYAGAEVTKFEENAVILSYAGGVTKIALVNLPPEARAALGVDDFLRKKQEASAEAARAEDVALAAKSDSLALRQEILASDYPPELLRQIAGYNSGVDEVNHWLTLASKEQSPEVIAEDKAQADKLGPKLDRDLKSFNEYKALLGGAGRANAAKIAAAVSEGYSYIGMPRVALRVSKGEPAAIHIRQTPFGESEQWVFKSDAGYQFYYFEGGRLTGAQE
jgi:hypothetical protein